MGQTQTAVPVLPREASALVRALGDIGQHAVAAAQQAADVAQSTPGTAEGWPAQVPATLTLHGDARSWTTRLDPIDTAFLGAMLATSGLPTVRLCDEVAFASLRQDWLRRAVRAGLATALLAQHPGTDCPLRAGDPCRPATPPGGIGWTAAVVDLIGLSAADVLAATATAPTAPASSAPPVPVRSPGVSAGPFGASARARGRSWVRSRARAHAARELAVRQVACLSGPAGTLGAELVAAVDAAAAAGVTVISPAGVLLALCAHLSDPPAEQRWQEAARRAVPWALALDPAGALAQVAGVLLASSRAREPLSAAVQALTGLPALDEQVPAADRLWTGQAGLGSDWLECVL